MNNRKDEDQQLVSILSIEGELKKMAVTLPDSGEKVGYINEVIIHPIKGKVMGLLFHTNEGMLRAVPTGDFFIFGNNKLVVIFESVLFDQFNAWQKLAGGLSVNQDIIGSSVVTDKGKYIGTVREVLIVESPLRAVYRVVESTWQKIFGGGFYIAAELPYAFSREGARFLVRTDLLMRNQASNPIEAIRLDDTQSVPSGGWQAARN